MFKIIKYVFGQPISQGKIARYIISINENDKNCIVGFSPFENESFIPIISTSLLSVTCNDCSVVSDASYFYYGTNLVKDVVTKLVERAG